MDPLLSHVTEAVYKLDFSRRYGNGNMLGMVSKVSAKYISYYADDLTSLLLDDILIDTV